MSTNLLHFHDNATRGPCPRRQLQSPPGGSGQVSSTAKLRISLQILNRIENLIILIPFGSVSGRGGQPSPPSDRTFLDDVPYSYKLKSWLGLYSVAGKSA
jgi:hypothetical protein